MSANTEQTQEEFKNQSVTINKPIVLAGATGHLGQRIAHHILQRGGAVRLLVRKRSTAIEINALREKGGAVVEVDFGSISDLTQACAGGSCVVSALSGLREVIVDVQSRLLWAAVDAGVPRFIPSDYCIDFTKLVPGSNRNLDLRREFAEVVDKAPIAATSVLNGMFTDLLTGQAPVVLSGPKLVLYWGNADQPLDFTTMENTAAFTASAALDPTTPRFLRIAGEVSTIRGLQKSALEAFGKQFRTLRLGGLGGLSTMIKITKTVFPQKEEVFPAWQGMQYLHDMFTGLPKLEPLDNDRYPAIGWTSVREVLATAK
ncbi:MAG: NmrA family NAD(P)-binding protein [Dyadobacter sp.]|uniref:NmrA family NAD(P)-binding protein n=1 Tax=Dyadobacter sp. TaxID=1914288 RepID=UPI003266D21F